MFPLECAVKSTLVAGYLTITVVGAMVQATVEEWREEIATSVRDSRARVMDLDLRRTTFLDDRGIEAIISAQRQFRGRHRVRVIVRDDSQIHQALLRAQLGSLVDLIVTPIVRGHA